MQDNTYLVTNSTALSEPIKKKRKIWKSILTATAVGTLLNFSHISFYLTVFLANIPFLSVLAEIFQAMLHLCPIALFISAITLVKLQKSHQNIIASVDGHNIVTSVFPGTGYIPERGFSMSEFKNAHLISFKNNYRFRSSNLISGYYNNMLFKYSDILIDRRSSTGRRHKMHVLVFSGYLIKIHSESLYGTDRVLFTNDTFHTEKYRTKNQTGYPEFDKNFTVYANDPSSIYSVVTPQRLQYIDELRNLGGIVYVCYDGLNRDLYIAISGPSFIEGPSCNDDAMQQVTLKAVNRLKSIQYHIDALI